MTTRMKLIPTVLITALADVSDSPTAWPDVDG